MNCANTNGGTLKKTRNIKSYGFCVAKKDVIAYFNTDFKFPHVVVNFPPGSTARNAEFSAR